MLNSNAIRTGLALIVAAQIAFTTQIAHAGGDQGAGNGGDTLVTRSGQTENDDPSTVVVSPDQTNGIGYFRLVGEPGELQTDVFFLSRCESNPDGVGPLAASCNPYTINNSALNLNLSYPLPPGLYEASYAGTNYWFKLKAGQRIETPLTKVLYPKTLHNAGLSMMINADYSIPYNQSSYLKDFWGMKYVGSGLETNTRASSADVRVVSLPVNSEVTYERLRPSCLRPDKITRNVQSCDPRSTPLAQENYHELYSRGVVQFTGEDRMNLLVVELHDEWYIGKFFLVDPNFIPSWSYVDGTDGFLSVSVLPRMISYGIPTARGPVYEGHFLSVLPGSYNTYAYESNGYAIKDDQGKIKIIQKLVVPDRTKSQGAPLEVEPLDWLSVPPSGTPTPPSKPSCWFFC